MIVMLRFWYVTQGNARSEFMKVEVIQVGQKINIGGPDFRFCTNGALLAKTHADVLRYGDGSDGMKQIHVVSGNGVRGQFGEVQAGVDEFRCVGRAVGLVGFAAFHCDGRAKFAEGHGLHAPGPDEIHHGAGKQGGEMKETRVELVNATVVWIDPGVVVHVDTGEDVLLAKFVDDLLHHQVFGAMAAAVITESRAGPASIVIRLTVEVALAMTRGLHVAEKNR